MEMHTLYSKIIWGELGYPISYRIPLAPPDEVNRLVLTWIKTAPLERVNEVLFSELSWFNTITSEGYYDGPYYGINQREKEKRLQADGTTKPDIGIHDIALEASILHLAIKTRMCSDQLHFIAECMDAYYSKFSDENPLPRVDPLEADDGTEL